ncbi:MAG TPA: bifunctional UDP-N-acetylglucosamine diphosphorylase/glucosamine-1-phosphate N-acetyltransferase GlmU [Myxococcota bacterium]|nr:bifunctional UDP-N-acetylglucosamine diphosphorylase/glucosamine-1-phosphate N-acetyltransferase GlmU [Myxococcota bacterium]
MHTTPAAIILAAGQGKRMQSSLPKVVHPCLALPMICHVVQRAADVGCNPIVVVVSPSTRAHVADALAKHLPDQPVTFAVQEVARGTGDAARAGLDAIPAHRGQVVILYGDVPLLTQRTLTRLQEAAREAPLAFLTAHVTDATGYGRVVRDAQGAAQEVVEHRDATEAQRAIHEVNAGVYWVADGLLREAVSSLSSDNAQGELYLTDVVKLAAARGGATAVAVEDPDEVRGVNSRAELAAVEAILRRRLIAEHQARGVTFLAPDQTFLGLEVTLERDVQIGVGVQLWGRTHVAEGARIAGPSVIIDSTVGPGAVVHAFSHLQSARMDAGAEAGPYARLRPDAVLEEGARIGNFVEVKASTLGKGAKANHLAYIGNATVGAGSNIGAGTITCNYDGFSKHKTEIGPKVFVGSNSTLVAPLKIGAGAFIAAGSTVTKEVPGDALAFGRAQQTNREGYAKTLKERLEAAKVRLSQGKKER